MDVLRCKYLYSDIWDLIKNFVRKVNMFCFSKVFPVYFVRIVLDASRAPGWLLVYSIAAKQLALIF